MRHAPLSLVMTLLAVPTACTLSLPTETGLTGDRDGDGALAMDDCDELNPAAYPGAPEVCDGVDNDCDGELPDDEDADWDSDGILRCADCNDLDDDLGQVAAYYRDADNDGYGTETLVKYDCDKPSGYVSNADDCDDGDPFSYPLQIWYVDMDGDGYGNPDFFLRQCNRPSDGWVNDASDCDDADPTEFPNQTWYPDADGDGYGGDSGEVRQCERPADDFISVGGDCNDGSATVFPGQDWAPDADGDGYGDSSLAIVSCGKPEDAEGAWVMEITDCDDTRDWVYPKAEERCDTVDSNCDGVLLKDELDEDGDGFGLCNGDPDDTDPTVFPLLTTWFGVEVNVSEAELVGWEECFLDTYDRYGSSLSSMQSACYKNNVMLACRQRGSGVLTAAAHAARSDVFYDTGSGSSSVHNANGVSFYYNSSWSMGFAEEGSGVTRNSCDTATTEADKRMCWHTSGGVLSSGWRCGVTTSVYTSSWERVVYHAD